MSRPLRFARALHTGGRHVPHPGLGGAGPASATQPSQPIPNPQSTLPRLSPPETFIPRQGNRRPAHLPDPIIANRTWTTMGRRKPHRPARDVPVALPSGYPEPPSWPPPPEYFTDLEARKRTPHPLWKFFHIPNATKTNPPSLSDKERDVNYMSVEVEEDVVENSRAWTADELRGKSFADLHTLWYILLQERNVLATQKDERRRLNVPEGIDPQLMRTRVRLVRQSMARIKYVLNERRLAFIAKHNPTLKDFDKPLAPWADPTGEQDALRNLSTWTDIKGANVKSPTLSSSQPSSSSFDREESHDDGAVEDEAVSKEEVESKDEGFGGGAEAEAFDKDVKIDEDGKVSKA